jgi:hypothetical protein
VFTVDVYFDLIGLTAASEVFCYLSGEYSGVRWTVRIDWQNATCTYATGDGSPSYVEFEPGVTAEDTWYIYTFDIHPDVGTFSIYKDGVQIANDLPLWINGTIADGDIQLGNHCGGSPGGQTSYFNYVTVGTDAVGTEDEPGDPSASESLSESPSLSPSASESPSPSPTPSYPYAGPTILFEHGMEDINGWSNGDSGSGTTSVETWQGKTTWKQICINNSSDCYKYKTVAISTLPITYITWRFWPDTLGTSDTSDFAFLRYSGWDLTDVWNLNVRVNQDQTRIMNPAGGWTAFEFGPTMDAWNIWTFEVRYGANPTVSLWGDGTLLINDLLMEVNNGSYPAGQLTIGIDSWFVGNLLNYTDYIVIGDGAAAPQDPSSASASESASESPSISPSNAPGPNSRSMITIYTFP